MEHFMFVETGRASAESRSEKTIEAAVTAASTGKEEKTMSRRC